MKRAFDVLVVGAGPAGSASACAAAKAGASVLVIDKRRQIGMPVQCAEYIPRPLTHKVKIPPEVIAQEIHGMITVMPSGEVIRKKAPGFILNRAEFDQILASRAAKAGAKFQNRTKALSKNGKYIDILGPLGEEKIKAEVIIGADGPGSTVGAWIGQQNKKFIWALQHHVILRQSTYDTEVYLGRPYPGGYAWFFPKRGTANVGVGIRKELGGSVKTALNIFKESIKDRIGKVLDVTSGRIPVGGPLASTDIGAGVILVGDACGHTHPITGGGIAQAVICGEMAGQAAAAAANGDKRAFDDYNQQWRGVFGYHLEKAAAKRNKMEAEWNYEDFDKLLKKSWVACEEYYHDY